MAEFGRGDEVESTVRWVSTRVWFAVSDLSQPRYGLFLLVFSLAAHTFSGSMAAKAVERTHSGGGTDPAAETVSLTFGEEVGCE